MVLYDDVMILYDDVMMLYDDVMMLYDDMNDVVWWCDDVTTLYDNVIVGFYVLKLIVCKQKHILFEIKLLLIFISKNCYWIKWISQSLI